MTIIAIAPATNFPSLLARYPDAPKKATIKAMVCSRVETQLPSWSLTQ